MSGLSDQKCDPEFALRMFGDQPYQLIGATRSHRGRPVSTMQKAFFVAIGMVTLALMAAIFSDWL